MTVLIAWISATQKGAAASRLEPLDLGLEQFGVHRQLAHLGAQPVNRLVAIVPLPRLQARHTRLQERIAPGAQVRGRHRQLPGHDLQGLASK